MVKNKTSMATAVSDFDRAKIVDAAKITGRNISEFLRLAATDAAEKIITEHKRAKRRARSDGDD